MVHMQKALVSNIHSVGRTAGFSRYKPETESSTRTPTTKQSEELRELTARFDSFLGKHTSVSRRARGLELDGLWRSALELVSPLHYCTSDVEHFSMALEAYQSRSTFQIHAGLFLSAIVEKGREDAFEFRINHIIPIHLLAYKNRKTVTVHGDVGDSAAHHARKGSMLVINGNAGEQLGDCMTGGDIIVNGNCGGMVGRSMKNGSITVNGDTAELAGYDMRNGRLSLEGEVLSFSATGMGGDIYHKGVRMGATQ